MSWDFPITYRHHKGTPLTRAQHQAVIRSEVQKKLDAVAETNRKKFERLREKNKTTKEEFRRLAELISRGNHGGDIQNVLDFRVKHAMAYPLAQCQPTHEERKAGIPVCCDHEMHVSRFDLGLWWCPLCRRNKVR